MQKISKQTDLVSKKDFDNILISFKTEYLQVQQKLNSPTSYRYFLSRMYFTSPIESQNMFDYQPTPDILELKRMKTLTLFLL